MRVAIKNKTWEVDNTTHAVYKDEDGNWFVAKIEDEDEEFSDFECTQNAVRVDTKEEGLAIQKEYEESEYDNLEDFAKAKELDFEYDILETNGDDKGLLSKQDDEQIWLIESDSGLSVETAYEFASGFETHPIVVEWDGSNWRNTYYNEKLSVWEALNKEVIKIDMESLSDFNKSELLCRVATLSNEYRYAEFDTNGKLLGLATEPEVAGWEKYAGQNNHEYEKLILNIKGWAEYICEDFSTANNWSEEYQEAAEKKGWIVKNEDGNFEVGEIDDEGREWIAETLEDDDEFDENNFKVFYV